MHHYRNYQRPSVRLAYTESSFERRAVSEKNNHDASENRARSTGYLVGEQKLDLFPSMKPHQVTSLWRQFFTVSLSSGMSFLNLFSFTKREKAFTVKPVLSGPHTKRTLHPVLRRHLPQSQAFIPIYIVK